MKIDANKVIGALLILIVGMVGWGMKTLYFEIRATRAELKGDISKLDADISKLDDLLDLTRIKQERMNEALNTALKRKR